MGAQVTEPRPAIARWEGEGGALPAPNLLSSGPDLGYPLVTRLVPHLQNGVDAWTRHQPPGPIPLPRELSVPSRTD